MRSVRKFLKIKKGKSSTQADLDNLLGAYQNGHYDAAEMLSVSLPTRCLKHGGTISASTYPGNVCKNVGNGAVG